MTTQKNKGWLSDNIASIIALSFMLFAFSTFLLILLKQVKTSESTTITILATISNILMLVFGYYFGSTKGSRDKDTQITALIQKPTAADTQYWISIIKQCESVDALESIRSKIPQELKNEFEIRMNELKQTP